MRHLNASILTGDVTKDNKFKILSIESDCVIIAFGKDFDKTFNVTFQECEALFA
jgi:hypothetical protein